MMLSWKVSARICITPPERKRKRKSESDHELDGISDRAAASKSRPESACAGPRSKSHGAQLAVRRRSVGRLTD